MTGVWALVLLAACGQGEASDFPRVVDPRLKLELFAEALRSSRRWGLRSNARPGVGDRESHAFPAPGLSRPKGDRIRLLEDTNHDGRADKVTTFFEGLQSTMSLALYRDGSVYVASAPRSCGCKDRTRTEWRKYASHWSNWKRLAIILTTASPVSRSISPATCTSGWEKTSARTTG